MANQEIREKIRETRLKQWEVAENIGISEGTFTRWLRSELPAEKRNMIMEAIDSMTKKTAG